MVLGWTLLGHHQVSVLNPSWESLQFQEVSSKDANSYSLPKVSYFKYCQYNRKKSRGLYLAHIKHIRNIHPCTSLLINVLSFDLETDFT